MHDFLRRGVFLTIMAGYVRCASGQCVRALEAEGGQDAQIIRNRRTGGQAAKWEAPR